MDYDLDAERLIARKTFKPMPIIECKECGVIVERTKLTSGMVHQRLCRGCYYDRCRAYREQAEYPDQLRITEYPR